MTLQSLTRQELASRLAGPGVGIQCGPLLIRIATSLSELVDPVALLYADYALVEGQDIPDFAASVEPISRWRTPKQPGATTVVDGRPVFDPFPRAQALPMLEWVMNWCVFTRPHQFLLLHSAVVEWQGGGLVLSGQPGAGKSTLCAALVARGARLLSDEVAVIPPGTRDLLPLPRPIGLKEESIAIVRTDWPAAVIGPPTPGTRKGTVAHVRPPTDSVRRAQEPASPRWIVFPTFAAGAEPDVRRVSRADALLRLGHESFNYSTLGVTGFRTLADVVEGCDCFEIRYGSLADAIDCVMSVTDAAPVGTPPQAAGPGA